MQPTSEETLLESATSTLPVSEVKNVVLYSIAGAKQQELSESEKSEVLDALAKVEWSETGSQSYLNHDGGLALMFRLELENGQEIDFAACNPFYIIDAMGYKAEYKICDAISDLYWQLVAEHFPENLIIH